MAESANTGLGVSTGETTARAADTLARAADTLVRASQVAREAEVRHSANGVRFATFGETGVPGPDLDRMLEAVPPSIADALNANTYFFVPLVFISTRLMGDRFALSFEFFINVAHAFIDTAGVPERFAELAWRQAQSGVRGETSLDAWEARHLALGKPIAVEGEPGPSMAGAGGRRGKLFGQGTGLANRSFGSIAPAAAKVVALNAAGSTAAADEKERQVFLESAFSDALAIYLLSLVLDLDYSELRERDYPLLAPGALAERLRLIAELYPANGGYEFAVRYRRRA